MSIDFQTFSQRYGLGKTYFHNLLRQAGLDVPQDPESLEILIEEVIRPLTFNATVHHKIRVYDNTLPNKKRLIEKIRSKAHRDPETVEREVSFYRRFYSGTIDRRKNLANYEKTLLEVLENGPKFYGYNAKYGLILMKELPGSWEEELLDPSQPKAVMQSKLEKIVKMFSERYEENTKRFLTESSTGRYSQRAFYSPTGKLTLGKIKGRYYLGRLRKFLYELLDLGYISEYGFPNTNLKLRKYREQSTQWKEECESWINFFDRHFVQRLLADPNAIKNHVKGKGIVHFDARPANVLRTEEGEYTYCDLENMTMADKALDFALPLFDPLVSNAKILSIEERLNLLRREGVRKENALAAVMWTGLKYLGMLCITATKEQETYQRLVTQSRIHEVHYAIPSVLEEMVQTIDLTKKIKEEEPAQKEKTKRIIEIDQYKKLKEFLERLRKPFEDPERSKNLLYH